MKVLVIEDDKMNRRLFQDMLECAGYEVIVASDAREGIEKAKCHP